MIKNNYALKDRFFIAIFITFILGVMLYAPQFIFSCRPELNVYTYSDTLNLSAVAYFEKVTGTKVNVKFYDTPGEFFTELKARGGRGYDVIFPTNYSVEQLIKEGLLQKLDYSKIPNACFIDQRLLHKSFDPKNVYSIPFAWGTIGIGYDKKVFSHFAKTASWKAIFEPHSFSNPSHRVNVTDNYLEMVFLASIYLFGTTAHISENLTAIKQLLIAQKPWVENYTGGNQKYLLKGEVTPLLIAESAVMKKMMQEDDRFGFVVPQEGSVYAIESCAISSGCTKTDLAHAFINFMISEKVSALTWQNGYNPSNIVAYKEIEQKFFNDKSFFPDNDMFKKLHLIHNQVPLKKIEEMWLQIKLA